MPVPIMDNAVVTVGSNLYSFAGVSNNAVVANSYRFDGTTWTAIASMPATVESPAAATDGTNVYLVGGADGGTGNALTTLYRYNVGSNTYTTLAPCNTAAWNSILFYNAGKLYKVGGTNDVPASLATVEIYDIAANTWSAGAPLPQAESFPMGFVQGGFIYVGGGIDATSNARERQDLSLRPRHEHLGRRGNCRSASATLGWCELVRLLLHRRWCLCWRLFKQPDHVHCDQLGFRHQYLVKHPEHDR